MSTQILADADAGSEPARIYRSETGWTLRRLLEPMTIMTIVMIMIMTIRTT